MAPDDRAAHSGKPHKPSDAKAPPVNQAERTDLFEEFTRPQQPGEKPKPKGLNAAGYKFPPEVGAPALTKENIAKGVPFDRATPPAPAPELKDANPMFETYERPDLADRPRTGTGIRPPPPKSAKEILQGYQPPQPPIL